MPPDQGLPLDHAGGSQIPVIGSRSTRSPCAPPAKKIDPRLFQYSGAGAADKCGATDGINFMAGAK